jgi:hypothetical protein
METKPIECSLFTLSEKFEIGRIVSCDVRYDDRLYRASEIYDDVRDSIRTDDRALMRVIGLIRVDGRHSRVDCNASGFWRFLDIEPGSEDEIEATRIEETILAAMRAFIDRRLAAMPEAA